MKQLKEYYGWVRGLRRYSTATAKSSEKSSLCINKKTYPSDHYTNVTPKILSLVNTNLHNQTHHPLCLVKQRIVSHFYGRFIGARGTPQFSVHDNLSPVVSVRQNFDDLLIPEDHVSRSKSDCYYINREYLLRAHMTAHQAELIRMGLNNFLLFGDVYRRDEIDSTHYPVFHQGDAVRLCTADELSKLANSEVQVFEKRPTQDTEEKQGVHTLDATRIMEHQLKSSLLTLAQKLFGQGVECRWVEQYFPFTHPSWELEVKFNGDWLEVVGCGVMRQEIPNRAGASDRIGWAFGLGLERLAMILYQIPDIRLFWSKDSGFLSQFQVDDPDAHITYRPVSLFPQCVNDLSFWLPSDRHFSPNDFYELARDVGGDLVEQIKLQDEFTHPKTGRRSHCYRIIYRHLERTLTQQEVNLVHDKIARLATDTLGVTIR